MRDRTPLHSKGLTNRSCVWLLSLQTGFTKVTAATATSNNHSKCEGKQPHIHCQNADLLVEKQHGAKIGLAREPIYTSEEGLR